jgi:hypothetical protein
VFGVPELNLARAGKASTCGDAGSVANRRSTKIRSSIAPIFGPPRPAWRAAHELGEYYALTQEDIATRDSLIAELQVEERLDAAIEKCIKRLLMLRGVKSMSMSSSQPAHPSKPRSAA